MTLDEARANIGAAVVYSAHPDRREDGTITSVNEQYVFVRYLGDKHSKATMPEDLALNGGGRHE
jgi:hypothetical protein